MSITYEYSNVADERLGHRTAVESETFVDSVIRSTGFSANVGLDPPLTFVSSIFLGNYRDESTRGANREPYVVYLIASVASRSANRFHTEVWLDHLFEAQGTIASLFSGVPSGELPAKLQRGQVHFDWSQQDALMELSFPVPGHETAGSFESSCRALEALLAESWRRAEQLSVGVVTKNVASEAVEGKVFLCHSHKDKTFVRRLAEAIKAAKVETWFDEENILVGHDFVEKVMEGIDAARFVAVVLSPNFVSSGPWAQEEFRSALVKQVRDGRVTVLPILWRDCEIPALLSTKKYADFRKSFDIGIGQLLRAIRCDETQALPNTRLHRTAATSKSMSGRR